MDPQNQNYSTNNNGSTPNQDGSQLGYNPNQVPDYTPKVDPAISNFANSTNNAETFVGMEDLGNISDNNYNNQTIYPANQGVQNQPQGAPQAYSNFSNPEPKFQAPVNNGFNGVNNAGYYNNPNQTPNNQPQQNYSQQNQSQYRPLGTQGQNQGFVAPNISTQNQFQPVTPANNVAPQQPTQFFDNIETNQQAPAFTRLDTPMAQTVYPNSKKSNLGFWIFLVFLILILGGGIFAAWKYQEQLIELISKLTQKTPATQEQIVDPVEVVVEEPEVVTNLQYLSAVVVDETENPIYDVKVLARPANQSLLDLEQIALSGRDGVFIVNRTVSDGVCNMLRLEADSFFPTWRQTVNYDYFADNIVLKKINGDDAISTDFNQSQNYTFTVAKNITFDFSNVQLQKYAGFLQDANTTVNLAYFSNDNLTLLNKEIPLDHTNDLLGVFAVDFVDKDTGRLLVFSADSVVPVSFTASQNHGQLLNIYKLNECTGEWEPSGSLDLINDQNLYSGAIFKPGWYKLLTTASVVVNPAILNASSSLELSSSMDLNNNATTTASSSAATSASVNIDNNINTN